MRGAVVVQFVLEQGYFCVEQDWVWTGKFSEGDGVRQIVWISVNPHLCIGCISRIRVVPAISRRICPVIRFRSNGSGEWQVRPGVCAGFQRSEATHTFTRARSHRLFNQASAYPTLTPPSPSPSSPPLTPANAPRASSTIFHPDGRCSSDK